MLSIEHEDDLAGLAWNWEGAYEFEITDGIWIARSVLDRKTILTACTADELRDLVRSHYTSRPAGALRPPVTSYLSERMST
jgi:hypothetical protein